MNFVIAAEKYIGRLEQEIIRLHSERSNPIDEYKLPMSEPKSMRKQARLNSRLDTQDSTLQNPLSKQEVSLKFKLTWADIKGSAASFDFENGNRFGWSGALNGGTSFVEGPLFGGTKFGSYVDNIYNGQQMIFEVKLSQGVLSFITNGKINYSQSVGFISIEPYKFREFRAKLHLVRQIK